MLGWLFGRELKDVLNETKKIKVCGVRFTIKKVNLLNHLDGSKVLLQSFDTHKTEGAKQALSQVQQSEKKIKDHYSAVLMAGVVEPALCWTEEDAKAGKGIWVDQIYTNWEMVDELYSQIMILTYGKKKMKQAILAARNLSKSTT